VGGMLKNLGKNNMGHWHRDRARKGAVGETVVGASSATRVCGMGRILMQKMKHSKKK